MAVPRRLNFAAREMAAGLTASSRETGPLKPERYARLEGVSKIHVMRRKIERGVAQVKGSPGQYRGVFVCPFCKTTFPVAGRPRPLDKCQCGAVVNGWPWIEKESKLMPHDSDDDEDTAVDIDISEI